MRRCIALCVVAGLSVGAGCNRKTNSTSAGLTVDGQAEVAEGGGTWSAVSGDRRLHDGDQVRVLDGTATVSMSDDRELGLRKDTQLTMLLGTSGGSGAGLTAGDLLVIAPENEVTVNTDEVTARVAGGAARVSRGQTVVVGSYTAEVDLQSAGQSMQVPPLRQVGVPAAGLLPPGPAPLRYSPDDPWDQRFLAAAVQLRDELQARSQGFTAQVPSARLQTPELFRRLVTGLADEPLDVRVAPPRPAGESLVGLAIAAAGRDGSFPDRWNEVIAFRDAGADWGLVAMDQQVERVPLLAEIDAAIGRGLTEFLGPATSGGPSPPAGEAPSAAVAAPSGGGGTTSAVAPAPTPANPGTTAPSSTTENPGPLRTGIAPVDAAANSLVDLLSGLLKSLGQ